MVLPMRRSRDDRSFVACGQRTNGAWSTLQIQWCPRLLRGLRTQYHRLECSIIPSLPSRSVRGIPIHMMAVLSCDNVKLPHSDFTFFVNVSARSPRQQPCAPLNLDFVLHSAYHSSCVSMWRVFPTPRLLKPPTAALASVLTTMSNVIPISA